MIDPRRKNKPKETPKKITNSRMNVDKRRSIPMNRSIEDVKRDL